MRHLIVIVLALATLGLDLRGPGRGAPTTQPFLVDLTVTPSASANTYGSVQTLSPPSGFAGLTGFMLDYSLTSCSAETLTVGVTINYSDGTSAAILEPQLGACLATSPLGSGFGLLVDPCGIYDAPLTEAPGFCGTDLGGSGFSVGKVVKSLSLKIKSTKASSTVADQIYGSADATR